MPRAGSAVRSVVAKYFPIRHFLNGDKMGTTQQECTSHHLVVPCPRPLGADQGSLPPRPRVSAQEGPSLGRSQRTTALTTTPWGSSSARDSARLGPSSRRMRQTIVARAHAGACVLVSSHLLHLVEEICTRVVIMDRGKKMADGTVAELAARADLAAAGSSLEQIFLHVTGRE